MKNKFLKALLLLVTILSTSIIYAQSIDIGIRGGVGGGSIETRPFWEKNSSFGVPVYGLSILYKGKLKYLDALEANVNYTTSQFSWLAKNKSDSSYTRKINAIEIPIMWHAYYSLDNDRLNIFLNLGPYISYDISSKESWIGNDIGNSAWETRTQDYEYSNLKDNRFGYGAIGGIGISYIFAKRITISAEARYRFGFNDIYKNPVNYPTSTYYQAQVSQYRFSAGISYRIWKIKE
ncbi:MAG: PorT family protein [Bacteroidetes bacterium]|nr:PorT family protein [Bacteroidota bacterium]